MNWINSDHTSWFDSLLKCDSPEIAMNSISVPKTENIFEDQQNTSNAASWWAEGEIWPIIVGVTYEPSLYGTAIMELRQCLRSVSETSKENRRPVRVKLGQE